MSWFSELFVGGHKDEVLRKGGYQPVKGKDDPKGPPIGEKPRKTGSCQGGIVKGLNVPIMGDYRNVEASAKSSDKSIGGIYVNMTIDPATLDSENMEKFVDIIQEKLSKQLQKGTGLAALLDARYERRK